MQEAPKNSGAAPVCCACTVIPFMVCFYMWAFQMMDPAHCWVTEGQLWVSSAPTGAANETDVAEAWRSFFVVSFWIHLAMVVLLCLAGCFSFVEKLVAVGASCGGLGCCVVLAKWGIWVWAIMLRFSDSGSVAAGKMIEECQNANPGMAAGNQWVSDISDALNQDGDERRLQATSTASASAFIAGASCDDPGAFQISGGRLFFAWIIISAVKCI